MSMRMILIALACILALCVRGHAGEVAITGPTAVPVAGFPCTLHLEGEMPEGTTVGWTVTPRNDQVKQIEPGRDGVSAKLTTLAGTWNVCAAIHEPEKPIYFRFYVVHVPGEPYTPSPGPVPTPPQPPTPAPVPTPTPPAPPTPPVPTPEPVSNRFGLRSKTAETARGITSPNRAAEILCLAQGLAALAEQIRKGEVSGPQAIVIAIGAVLDRCTSTAWDASREGLAAFIDGLIRSGQLTTNEDWRQAVREAEAGLRDAL